MKDRNGPLKDAAKEKIRLGILITPFLIIFTIFTVTPVIQTILAVFSEIDLTGGFKWAGLQNLSRLMSDSVFAQSVKISLILAFVLFPVSFAVNIILAYLLSRAGKLLRRVLLPVFFLPFIVGDFSGLNYIFSGEVNGYLNSLLIYHGAYSVINFSNELWVMLLSKLWLSFGLGFIVLYSAFTALPREYHDAAAMEHKPGFWRELWLVALPLIRPNALFAALIIFASAIAVSAFPTDRLLSISDYSERLMAAGETAYSAAVSIFLYFFMALVYFVIKKLTKRREGNYGTKDF